MTAITSAELSVRGLVMELAQAEDELRAIRFAPMTPECRSRRKAIVRHQAEIIRALRRSRAGAAGHRA